MASDYNDQCSTSSQVPTDPCTVPEENDSFAVDNWNSEVYKFEQNSLIKNKLGLIVNKRYQIVQRIDAGAFGSTYIGEDLKNNRQRVAVKFDAEKIEWKKSKNKENHLKYEYEVYKSALYDDGFETVDGFAQVYWFGYQFGHNILVMELLGASVASLFTFCDRKFGWQTILSLAQQMISRLKHIHQRGFIHRDLKPENFIMGLAKKETTCYLIDFGLARRYRFRHPEDRTLKHIPFRRGRSFIGTAKYASINSHRSLELSRRDDLESIGYVLIELINGHLPWRNICRRNNTNKHQTYMRIRAAKEQTNWTETCPSMADYMRYCRELQFAEEPNYEKVLEMLRARLIEEQNSTTLPRMIAMKCEVCRALDAKEVRPRIERIEEENSVSPPSEPQNELNTQPSTSYPCLAANLDPPMRSTSTDPTSEGLALKLDGIKLTSSNNPMLSPKRSFYLTTQNFTLTAPVKLSQSSVDNFSQNSSLENLKSNLSANVDLSLPPKKASSEATEEDADSVNSCQNCRQQKQAYFDQEFTNSDAKLSWQIFRDSTPDTRFDYDNRFNWTLPVAPRAVHFPVHNIPNFAHPPPMLCPSMPPPAVPFHFHQQYIGTHPNNGQHPQFGQPNFTGYAPMRPPFYQQNHRVFCMFPPQQPNCGSFV